VKKTNIVGQSTQKLEHEEDRHAHRQTDAIEDITSPHSPAVTIENKDPT